MRQAPSLDLVRRAVEVDAAYTLARMRVLERLAGNPIGIGYQCIENVTAFLAKNLPSPWFNRVVGLRGGQADKIEPLVEWYRAQGMQPRFDIASGEDAEELGRKLARLGFFQSGWHATLIDEAEGVLATQDAAIERVTTAEAMDDFLAAYVAGWDVAPSWSDQFKSNVRPWLHEPGWAFYLARVEGRPAAAAILYMQDEVSYLADAATDPAYRRRGLHAALLRRRMRDAHAAGAAFVFSGADFLSTSHRDMERAGMRLLFLRAIWTQLG